MLNIFDELYKAIFRPYQDKNPTDQKYIITEE